MLWVRVMMQPTATNKGGGTGRQMVHGSMPRTPPSCRHTTSKSTGYTANTPRPVVRSAARAVCACGCPARAYLCQVVNGLPREHFPLRPRPSAAPLPVHRRCARREGADGEDGGLEVEAWAGGEVGPHHVARYGVARGRDGPIPRHSLLLVQPAAGLHPSLCSA